MKRKRFTEEQIIGILKEAEAGAKSIDLCRRHAISQQTFYRWKAKYAGLEVNEARRLRTLEHENSRLKRLVADLTLDNQALKELVGKKPGTCVVCHGGNRYAGEFPTDGTGTGDLEAHFLPFDTGCVQ